MVPAVLVAAVRGIMSRTNPVKRLILNVTVLSHLARFPRHERGNVLSFTTNGSTSPLTGQTWTLQLPAEASEHMKMESSLSVFSGYMNISIDAV